MARYRCNWKVKHDGLRLKAGDVLELDEDTARPLLRGGAISPTDAEATDQKAEYTTLVGTDALPADVEIRDGNKVQLGDLVSTAFAVSGLSVEAWNALPAAERDARIAGTLDGLKEAARKAADAGNAADKSTSKDGSEEGGAKDNGGKASGGKSGDAKKAAAKTNEAKSPAGKQPPGKQPEGNKPPPK